MKKTTGGATTVYIFSGSKVIAEYPNGGAPTAPTREYIYAGSQLVASLTSSGTPTYAHPDQLSARVFTDSAGTKIGERGNYPFGEVRYDTMAADKWKFTTYERDAESGLDYAMFRFDSPRLGRFQTPDPLAGSAFNPQTLNRYAYAINDPTNFIDPLGLKCTWSMWVVDERDIISGGLIFCTWEDYGGMTDVYGNPITIASTGYPDPEGCNPLYFGWTTKCNALANEFLPSDPGSSEGQYETSVSAAFVQSYAESNQWNFTSYPNGQVYPGDLIVFLAMHGWSIDYGRGLGSADQAWFIIGIVRR